MPTSRPLTATTDTTVPTPPHAACRPPRSLAPDLARGLMLALIAMANIPWFLWGQPGTSLGVHVPARNALDTVVHVVMGIAVDGRSFPLFAFLFGYGMVQFYRSRIDRGLEPRTVRRMLRRRHWAMLLLGFLHALLLFLGDILGAYGIAGLLLVWIFFGRRDRTLLIWVSVLTALFTVYSLLSVASGLWLSTQPEIVEEMASGGAAFSMAAFRDIPHGEANYLVAAGLRVGMWSVTLPGIALGVAVPVAIMLGWLAARRRVLDEPWNHLRLLRVTAVVGILIGWLGGLPRVLMQLGVLDLPDALFWTFMGVESVTGLACGLGYAAAFGLLAAHLEGRTTPTPVPAQATPVPAQATPVPAQAIAARKAARAALVAQRSYGEAASGVMPEVTRRVSGPVRAVAAVGRRSLTFYLFQSIILAPLLCAWGVGLGPHLSSSAAAALALGVWLVSVLLAAWMDARDLQGPAERVLRRLTYGKLDASAGRSRNGQGAASPRRP